MAAERAVSFLRAVTAVRDSDGTSLLFDTTALAGLHSPAAPAPGCFTCALPVSQAVVNANGTLHGGCIATLVDVVGTAALLTVSEKSGVSLNINCNYLSKAALGSSVVIDAQVVRAGKRVATIDVRITEAASGELVAQGSHMKYIADQEQPITAIVTQQGRAAPPGPPPRSKL